MRVVEDEIGKYYKIEQLFVAIIGEKLDEGIDRVPPNVPLNENHELCT